MSSEVSCPLCGLPMCSELLETHLREELRYFPWRCGVCLVGFAAHTDAVNHFRGRFPAHVASAELLFHRPDYGLEERLATLIDAADPAAIQTLGPATADVPAPTEEEKERRSPEVEELEQAGRYEKVEEEEEADESGADSIEAMDADLRAAVTPPPPVTPPVTKEPRRPSTEKLRRPSEKAGGRAGDKLFNCRTCGCTQTRANARKHVLRAHSALLPYACRLCDQAFARTDKLKLHQKRAHNISMSETSVRNKMEELRPTLDAAVLDCFGIHSF